MKEKIVKYVELIKSEMSALFKWVAAAGVTTTAIGTAMLNVPETEKIGHILIAVGATATIVAFHTTKK